MATQIYQGVIQIVVEYPNGPVSIPLDKLKGHLSQLVQLSLDLEGVDPPDDQHSVIETSIDWETLSPGSITHSNWQCPGCGESVEVDNRELETIGTPMCADCDREMIEK